MNPETPSLIVKRRRVALARQAFTDTAERYGAALASALQGAGYSVDPGAGAHLLVRLARSCSAPSVVAALRDFEVVVRPNLLAYVQACRRAAPSAWRAQLSPQAERLVEHFDRFTEVPIAASRVHRVVIWLRRTLRALRETGRDHEH